MSYRYIYDVNSAIALQKPELQSSALVISVSTLLADTFVKKLKLRGEILHEEPLHRCDDSTCPYNDTMRELDLQFGVISPETIFALTRFRRLEHLCVSLYPSVDFNDAEHGYLLLKLLTDMPNLRCLSIKFRVRSPLFAQRLVHVLTNANHTVHELPGIAMDLGRRHTGAQNSLQSRLQFLLKLNRHGRVLWRSSPGGGVPPGLWAKVLARSAHPADTDVAFETFRAVSWVIRSAKELSDVE